MLYFEYDALSTKGAIPRTNFYWDHGSLEKGVEVKESLDNCENFLSILHSTDHFLQRGKLAKMQYLTRGLHRIFNWEVIACLLKIKLL